MSAIILKKELKKHASLKRKKVNMSFFKTGPGEYGEGDKFIGVTVPNIRKVVKEFYDLSFSEITKVLHSPIHEERLAALFIINEKFKKGDSSHKDKIYKFYVKNMKYINNWDLVDTSAPYVTGPYLFDRNRADLKKWVKSKNLWVRRISIISTFYFIKNNDFKDTLALSKTLLKDEHDLIHKAVGWMLREMGKRDQKVLEKFLKEHYQKMPRTMLRYSIEKLSEPKRQAYLKGRI